jgi:hypothetical protein
MTVSEYLASFGVSLVTTGGAVYGAIKLYGSKWLEARFANQLEGVKLEGQRQLEGIKQEGQGQLEASRQAHAADLDRLKFERADLLDRSAKLNQREFEVVPAIWKEATTAHFRTMDLIAVFQQHADVGAMDEARFEAFIEQSRLEPWQRDQLRALDRFERTRYYGDALKWFRLNDANRAVVAFNLALLEQSIFVHPDTHARFEVFADPLRKAFNRFSVNMQMGDEYRVERGEDDPVGAYRNQGHESYETMGRYLRERYWINAAGQAV